jgi:hypothetical protein
MPVHMGTSEYEHAVAPELELPRDPVLPDVFALPILAHLDWKQMHPNNQDRLENGKHLMVAPCESVSNYTTVKYVHHFTVPMADSGDVMVYRHCSGSYAPLLVRRMPGRVLVLNIEVVDIPLPPNVCDIPAVKVTALFLSGAQAFERVYSTLDTARVAEVREHIRDALIAVNKASQNSDIRMIKSGEHQVLRGNARLWIYRERRAPLARRQRAAPVMRRPSAAISSSRSIKTFFKQG